MSDATEILTTIDDYLISIADGLRYAQAELGRAGAAGAAGSQVSYYVPKLDFELKMTLKVVEDSALSGRYGRDALSPARDRHLMFAPIHAEQTSRASFSAEIVSTIRGSFVAVPANDGLPTARLRLSVQRGVDDYQIEARLRDALGKPLAGVEVQFNLDRDDSAALSLEAGVRASPLLAPGTALDLGVASTGADGIATATLRIDPAQARGSLLVLVVDAAGQSETHVVEVPA